MDCCFGFGVRQLAAALAARSLLRDWGAGVCRKQASGTRKRKQACALHKTTQCNVVMSGFWICRGHDQAPIPNKVPSFNDPARSTHWTLGFESFVGHWDFDIGISSPPSMTVVEP
jgi:hypothetical protein